MRLRDVKTIVQFGKWMDERGFRVTEGPDPFGPVTPGVHVASSLHYKDLAFDVTPRDTEIANLRQLYDHVLRFRTNNPKWPLDEMFYDGLGFVKEDPLVNHPILGHDSHLHIGFSIDIF